jgi:hypothetical protein
MRITFYPADTQFALTARQVETVDYLVGIGERDGAVALVVEAPLPGADCALVDLIGADESTSWHLHADGSLVIR